MMRLRGSGDVDELVWKDGREKISVAARIGIRHGDERRMRSERRCEEHSVRGHERKITAEPRKEQAKAERRGTGGYLAKLPVSASRGDRWPGEVAECGTPDAFGKASLVGVAPLPCGVYEGSDDGEQIERCKLDVVNKRRVGSFEQSRERGLELGQYGEGLGFEGGSFFGDVDEPGECRPAHLVSNRGLDEEGELAVEGFGVWQLTEFPE